MPGSTNQLPGTTLLLLRPTPIGAGAELSPLRNLFPRSSTGGPVNCRRESRRHPARRSTDRRDYLIYIWRPFWDVPAEFHSSTGCGPDGTADGIRAFTW